MQYFDNNNNLKSNLRIIKYSYLGNNLEFYSDLGVFSKSEIDEGSKLLTETFMQNSNDHLKVLDVGCGYGFIGICLTKIKNDDVTMVDVNNRALHLTEMNLKQNKVSAKVFNSNMYEKVIDKYAVIITNPPIRAGKSIYLGIINDSFNYLLPGGELWFVMRTNHGVKTVIKNLQKEKQVEVLNKEHGYYVVKVKN